MERTYFDGYDRVIQAVGAMSQKELIEHIEGLYGLGRVKQNSTVDEIRAEAIRQTKLDWLNPQADNYRMIQRILEADL